MDTHALLWALAVMALTGLLGLAVKEIAVFKSSKFVQQHAAAGQLLGMLDDICGAALAFLSANPTATPHAAAAWALSEIKASAPGLITQAGSLATDEALGYAVNRKLVTAAQVAPVSDAAKAVIADLAPSAVTARVSPTQVAAVSAAIIQAAPVTAEAVQAMIAAALAAPAATKAAALTPTVTTVAVTTPVTVAPATVSSM